MTLPNDIRLVRPQSKQMSKPGLPRQSSSLLDESDQEDCLDVDDDSFLVAVGSPLGQPSPPHLQWSNTIPGQIFAIMHDAMPATVKCQYIFALQRLVTLRHGPINWWGLFAGTCVGGHFREIMTQGWEAVCGVHIDMPTVLVAEKDPAKQTFITDQHSMPIVAPSVENLQGTYCKNIRPPHDGQIRRDPAPVVEPPCANNRTASEATVPGRTRERPDLMHQVFVAPPGGLDAGIPCISRTSLNANCSKNVNCVQQKTEATGIGFENTRLTCVAHSPEIVGLECVDKLFQQTDGGISDAEYMVKKMEEAGYWAQARIRDSRDCVSWVPRIRGWWGALRNLQGDREAITQWFDTVLRAFKSTKTLPPTAYVEINNDKRKRIAAELGIESHSDLGLRESFAANPRKDDALNWKCKHMEICENNKLRWPIDLASVPTPSFISYEGMLPREREAVALLDILWPPAHEEDLMYFVDINPTIERLCQRLLDEDGKPIPGSGPWHETPGTLVGSGKLCVRYKPTPRLEGHIYHIRLLEAFESMRMIGWDDSFWRDWVSYGTVLELTTTKQTEQQRQGQGLHRHSHNSNNNNSNSSDKRQKQQ